MSLHFPLFCFYLRDSELVDPEFNHLDTFSYIFLFLLFVFGFFLLPVKGVSNFVKQKNEIFDCQ